MGAIPYTDPACRFATDDADHRCLRNTGAPIHEGETCFLEARRQLFESEDLRHHPVPAADPTIISLVELVHLAEMALRTDVRTPEEQATLMRACTLLDSDLLAYALVEWTSQAMRTWKAKPCLGCDTPSIRRELPIDGPDRCDECRRAVVEDITSETVAS